MDDDCGFSDEEYATSLDAIKDSILGCLWPRELCALCDTFLEQPEDNDWGIRHACRNSLHEANLVKSFVTSLTQRQQRQLLLGDNVVFLRDVLTHPKCTTEL